MAMKPPSSQPSQAVVGITVAAVALAGSVLTPLVSSAPSPSPLVAVYDETIPTGERFDDQFREYVMRGGKPVLARLRVDLSSSTFVPRSEELQQLQELTVASPSLSKLSDWFGQLDQPLQRLESLSLDFASAEDESARVAELLSETLETISRKTPTIVSLELESPAKRGDANGCPAPRAGDFFTELKHFTSVGFDCRDRVRMMIGRADLQSLAIRHETIRSQLPHEYIVGALSADDLNAISRLDHLQRLSLIHCVRSSSALSDVVRATELNELNLSCKDVDLLTGFESLETLRIGDAAIHRSAMEQFRQLKQLRSLDLIICHPVSAESSFPISFQPPPRLERLTLSHYRAFAGVMPVVLNTPLHDVELSVELEKLYPDDMPLLKHAHHLRIVCARDPEVIEAIAQLDRLCSLDCCVWDASPDLLGRLFCMKSLKKLNLTGEFARDFEVALIEDTLDQIETAGPHHLQQVSLRLGDQQVHNYCRLLASLPALKTVTLQGPALNGDDLSIFRACRDLRTLNLVDCEFKHGLEEDLAALPHLQNLRIEDCWSPAEKPCDGNRWLHLEQLQLIDEPSFDVSRVTADRFLLGRRWRERDRRSLWLFEEEVE